MSETTYTDINGYTSETFASHTDREAKHAHRQAVLALRRLARGEYESVRSQAIRTLARERGGINAKTRDAIFAEAEQAGREAGRAVYLAKGYTPCSDPFGFDCQRLASPGYSACPFCTLKD